MYNLVHAKARTHAQSRKIISKLPPFMSGNTIWLLQLLVQMWTHFVAGTAHCANMYPARDDDLKQLTDARATIDKLIGMWLQDKRHA